MAHERLSLHLSCLESLPKIATNRFGRFPFLPTDNPLQHLCLAIPVHVCALTSFLSNSASSLLDYRSDFSLCHFLSFSPSICANEYFRYAFSLGDWCSFLIIESFSIAQTISVHANRGEKYQIDLYVRKGWPLLSRPNRSK